MLRRIIAAIILIILLLATWRWITFGFIRPEDVEPPREPGINRPLT
ncbi:MAG: hypothetical protein GEEBNDBF_00516 [bacterium]|nr:hypothetical protein [bacterium]